MATQPAFPIAIASDATVLASSVKDATTNTYLNTATVTYELTTSSGTSIDTGILSYVAASNGNYSGVIDASVTALLLNQRTYLLNVVIVQDNYKDTGQLRLIAYNRGSV